VWFEINTLNEFIENSEGSIKIDGMFSDEEKQELQDAFECDCWEIKDETGWRLAELLHRDIIPHLENSDLNQDTQTQILQLSEKHPYEAIGLWINIPVQLEEILSQGELNLSMERAVWDIEWYITKELALPSDSDISHEEYNQILENIWLLLQEKMDGMDWIVKEIIEDNSHLTLKESRWIIAEKISSEFWSFKHNTLLNIKHLLEFSSPIERENGPYKQMREHYAREADRAGLTGEQRELHINGYTQSSMMFVDMWYASFKNIAIWNGFTQNELSREHDRLFHNFWIDIEELPQAHIDIDESLNISLLSEEDEAIERSAMLWFMWGIAWHIAIEWWPAVLASVVPWAGTAAWAIVWNFLWAGIDIADVFSDKEAILEILKTAWVVPQEYHMEKTLVDNILAGIWLIPWATLAVKSTKLANLMSKFKVSWNEILQSMQNVLPILRWDEIERIDDITSISEVDDFESLYTFFDKVDSEKLIDQLWLDSDELKSLLTEVQNWTKSFEDFPEAYWVRERIRSLWWSLEKGDYAQINWEDSNGNISVGIVKITWRTGENIHIQYIAPSWNIIENTTSVYEVDLMKMQEELIDIPLSLSHDIFRKWKKLRDNNNSPYIVSNVEESWRSRIKNLVTNRQYTIFQENWEIHVIDDISWERVHHITDFSLEETWQVDGDVIANWRLDEYNWVDKHVMLDFNEEHYALYRRAEWAINRFLEQWINSVEDVDSLVSMSFLKEQDLWMGKIYNRSSGMDYDDFNRRTIAQQMLSLSSMKHLEGVSEKLAGGWDCHHWSIVLSNIFRRNWIEHNISTIWQGHSFITYKIWDKDYILDIFSRENREINIGDEYMNNGRNIGVIESLHPFIVKDTTDTSRTNTFSWNNDGLNQFIENRDSQPIRYITVSSAEMWDLTIEGKNWGLIIWDVTFSWDKFSSFKSWIIEVNPSVADILRSCWVENYEEIARYINPDNLRDIIFHGYTLRDRSSLPLIREGRSVA